MGNAWNSLPFFDRAANEEPLDKPSSVEAATSVTTRAAAEPIKDRRLDDQGQHSQTTTTSRPTNITVASVTEPKDQGETKTLESVKQSQVPLCVEEANVSTAVSVEGQPQTSLTSAAVGEGRGSGTSKTGHSTRTKRKRKTATHKRQHGE